MDIEKKFEFHFATIWEKVSDYVPDDIALVSGENKKNWRDYEQTSAKIASFLKDRGIKKNSKVGLYLFNCNEYLESQFATFKVMGVPINVNYRYKSEELIYLLDNSDSEAVFFHESYLDQILLIYKNLPNIKTWIQIGGKESPEINNFFLYENIVLSNEPMERIKRDEDNI